MSFSLSTLSPFNGNNLDWTKNLFTLLFSITTHIKQEYYYNNTVVKLLAVLLGNFTSHLWLIDLKTAKLLNLHNFYIPKKKYCI